MKYISISRQQGITLLESLIAIVVAAIGILGILGVQLRTLSDTQTTVNRAQAIRMIEDLGERMKVNPNALSNINSYSIGWDTATGDPALTPRANKLCNTSPCTSGEMAAYDIREWKRVVEGTLPLGSASVFAATGEGVGNSRLLGVMISWRENERDTSAAYKDAVDATKIEDGGVMVSAGDTCPADRTCHLQYIPVSARCAPYLPNLASGVVQFFCPGS